MMMMLATVKLAFREGNRFLGTEWGDGRFLGRVITLSKVQKPERFTNAGLNK
jgi:hypothetical protein